MQTTTTSIASRGKKAKRTGLDFEAWRDFLDRSIRRDARQPGSFRPDEIGGLKTFPVYLHVVGRRYRVSLPDRTSYIDAVGRLWRHLGLKGDPVPAGGDPNRYVLYGPALTKKGFDAKRIELLPDTEQSVIISVTAAIPAAAEGDPYEEVGDRRDYSLVKDFLRRAGVPFRRVRSLGPDRAELFVVLNDADAARVAEVVRGRTTGEQAERRADDPEGKKDFLVAGTRELSIKGQPRTKIVEKVYRLNQDSPRRYEIRSGADRPASRETFYRVATEAPLIPAMLAELVDALFRANAHPLRTPTPRRRSGSIAKNYRGRWRFATALKFPYLSGRVQQAVYIAVLRSGGHLVREELTQSLSDAGVKGSPQAVSNTLHFLERTGVLVSESGDTDAKPHRKSIALSGKFDLENMSKRLGLKL